MACVDLQKECKGTKFRRSRGKFILIYHYGRVKWRRKPVCMGNNLLKYLRKYYNRIMAIRSSLKQGFLSGKARGFVGFALILGMLAAAPAVAQNNGKLKVTGKIIDGANNAPLGYASIRLFKTTDSSFVSGAITDETGGFVVDIAAGTYYALSEFIGYKPNYTTNIKVSAANSPLNLGVIKVAASARTLDEVTVQAEKSSMELTLDKKIFNVGKDLAVGSRGCGG